MKWCILEPVGSTLYEVMNLYWVSIWQQWLVLGRTQSVWGVIDVIGSVEGIIYWKSGHLVRCYRCLTDWLTQWHTLKDRAPFMNIGAVVTQLIFEWGKYTKDIFEGGWYINIQNMRTCLALPPSKNDLWQLKRKTAAMNGFCLFSQRMLIMAVTTTTMMMMLWWC